MMPLRQLLYSRHATLMLCQRHFAMRFDAILLYFAADAA